jgi:hypothetical protein
MTGPFFAFRHNVESSALRIGELADALNKLHDKVFPVIIAEAAEVNLDAPADRAVTVRMPAALHELLKQQAHQHQISMNRLCLEKLAAEAVLSAGRSSRS